MSSFVLWVDGDSCPFDVRRIIERASRGRRVRTVVVADRVLPVVEHQFLDRIVVEPGPGATDRYIIEHVARGDIVVTRDVGLTSACADRDAVVIDDRGIRYTADEAAERRSIHRFMSALRERGLGTTGALRLSKRPTADFANALDRELSARNSAHPG